VSRISRLILLGLGLWFVACSAVAAPLSLLTNGFATSADYSSGRHSEEYSLYPTLAFNNRQFLTFGYDAIGINHPDWRYRQDMALVAASVNLQPWRVRGCYSRIEGKFWLRHFDYHYLDHADLASGEFLYSYAPLTFGLEYSHFSGRGYLRQQAQQYTLRAERIVSQFLSVSLRPNYSWTLDGRRLYSAYAKATIQPRASRWLFRAGGFLGERAYYFDNDLLLIYNQNETQRSLVFAQADWRVTNGFWLSAEFAHSEFRGYSINYLVAGLRTVISF
jgi:hypothetical protein